MEWTRRNFLRSASLAVIGGIFVPKYERWFRPNPIITFPPSQGGWGPAVRYAAIYDAYGRELMRAEAEFSAPELDGKGGAITRSQVIFPIAPMTMFPAKAAIIDERGTPLYELDSTHLPKLLCIGDQPIWPVSIHEH